MSQHHPPAPSSEEEGETMERRRKAPSSPEEGENRAMRSRAPSPSEEGVGGGGVTRRDLLRRAREMRNCPTEPERRLWNELRDSRLGEAKFRRQDVIGWRIVDFFCPAKGLVIEIDGHTHDAEIDRNIDQKLVTENGFATLRFTNEDVMRNMDGVLRTIMQALERVSDRWPNRGEHHPPAPSSEEEGGN